MGYFPVRYDSRVVIYKRKMFIRLATGVANAPGASPKPFSLLTVTGRTRPKARVKSTSPKKSEVDGVTIRRQHISCKTVWVVVVVQLVERSLPTPEIDGSNQVIGNCIK